MEEIDVLVVLPRRVLGATEGRRKPKRSEDRMGPQVSAKQAERSEREGSSEQQSRRSSNTIQKGVIYA